MLKRLILTLIVAIIICLLIVGFIAILCSPYKLVFSILLILAIVIFLSYVIVDVALFVKDNPGARRP